MAQEKKRLLIIEAAVRRFGHFGIAKTTMSEIAADLSMSKALLYYYFPDKNHLCAAALEYVIEQSFTQSQPALHAIKDCREALLFVLDSRMDFVKNYYNLLEYSVGSPQQMPKEIMPVFAKARSIQTKLFADILQRGVETGQLQPMNADEVANILLYSIEGMRFSILKNTGGLIFPSKEEFETILSLQKKMLGILIRGLAT